MRKKYIMAPGPTPIPAEVLAEASMPIMHHRTPQFQAIFKAASEGLQMFFRTAQPVMTFASVGTGVMESAVSNLTSPGEKVLVASCGPFWQSLEGYLRGFTGSRLNILRVRMGKAAIGQESRRSG